MTSKQFTKAMTLLGISQIALAEKLATNERTVRRWMTGDWPVPAPVAMLLNLMIETNTPLENLKP